ncbi:protein CHROMATIN REMODELING 20-like isoform X2 [Aristolochia californica]
MKTFVEDWEEVLDDLEAESALLSEQLDGAGIELPSLYKYIESQAPSGCSTDAWRKRIHWVGSQKTDEITESVVNAEKYLQSCRPLRRQRGKLLEEGASGYLGRKLAMEENEESTTGNSEKDWSSFNELLQSHRPSISFGSKHWASVYLAETPNEAANLGLKLPGVDEVEEIDDIENNPSDPFYAVAVASEKDLDLSEEQKKNFKKVKEEDDVKVTQKLQFQLKRRRHRCRRYQDSLQKEVSSVDRVIESEVHNSISLNENGELVSGINQSSETGNEILSQNLKVEKVGSVEAPEAIEGNVIVNGTSVDHSGSKRSYDSDDFENDAKRSRTVIIDSDDEVHVVEKISSNGTSCETSAVARSALKARKAIDIVDADAFPSPSPIGSRFLVAEDSMSFHCTACSKVLRVSEIKRHPLLEVIICEHCNCMVEERMHQKDPDCTECYCGWCGRSNDLISCKSCKILFCTTCVGRNFGEKRFSEVKVSGWICCCCSPALLHELIRACDKALEAAGQVSSSSDSDSDLSDFGIDVRISSKKRQNRGIRRILDDAELGEETKRKIAIEKARQEHLKSLQGKSWSKSTVNSNGTALEGADSEVLGDAIKGFIVNVAREENEEAERIPPSLSAKLKPHQIAGIRFMWENIIQSVRKVKSGDRGLGCILAHTMGLGKTIQVIAFLYTAMRSVDLGLRTALIVTPVNVLHNWRQEFVKWRPLELKPLRVFMLEDVSRERRGELLAKWRAKGGVFLIGYAAFRNLSLGKHVKDKYVASEICQALQNVPDIFVCDEAHMIKNTRADITQTLKQVKCQRRIALTGSPLQNNLMEYYCMVDFVREGFLGSSHEFRNRFQNPIENGQHTNSTSDDVKIMNQRSHILYEQLKGFVQRMDMNVVKKDLPPKTVFVITVKLSSLQRKLYKRFLDVHGFTNVTSEEAIRRSCFFAGYQALAQIWNHPGLLQLAKEYKDRHRQEDAVESFLVDDSSSDDNMDQDIQNGEKLKSKHDFSHRKSEESFFHEQIDWWKDLLQEKNYKVVNYSGKMVLLLDILSMSAEVGDKALVFSQSLPTLDLIELFLSKLPRKGREGKYWKQGKDWYRLDGSTAGSERQKLVERFNEPRNRRVKCTLISTRAGSLGINLHAANRVILVDGSWNPTNDLQAIYRVWRYGQIKPVYAYRLMAHGTMEEKIYKRQVTKEGLAARVVDRQQIHRTMSKEEMLHLFDFGDDDSTDPKLEQKSNQDMSYEFGGSSMKKKGLPFSQGSCSDKFMETLVSRYYPRWIANYHEHESLLQENEEEKLSKEEKEMAWEVFRRSLEWEELQRVSFEESLSGQKPVATAALTMENSLRQTKHSIRNRTVQRKCTNLAHLLTLRSQGTKSGSSTICGECAQEISWERLHRDGKAR